MNSEEIWKPVPGYGGHYEASSLGRVRAKDRIVEKVCSGLGLGKCKQFYPGRLLNPSKNGKYGHTTVHISVDGNRLSVGTHRMVLLAFVGTPISGQEACHNNGNAWDNRIGNLRWDTHAQNNKDRLKHGTYARGSSHRMARLTDEQALDIASRRLHYEEYAAMYGISRTQAHRVWSGKAWRHLSTTEQAHGR